jgi:hypothetical protein
LRRKIGARSCEPTGDNQIERQQEEHQAFLRSIGMSKDEAIVVDDQLPRLHSSS